MKSEFCLKPFPVLLPISTKERKILPSVVSKEIRVFGGPVKAPLGSKLGVEKEFTFLKRDPQCIFLKNSCLEVFNAPLQYLFVNFPRNIYCPMAW